jgi:lipoprotein-releasing system ATP-binding protein
VKGSYSFTFDRQVTPTVAGLKPGGNYDRKLMDTTAKKQILVKTEGLTKSFWIGKQELQVLKGIELAIREGEIVAVVGPSGAGKSTLLHLLGALDRPTSGRITFNDHVLTDESDMELARIRNLEIGFVFQFHHLMPEFTALENTLIPALISGKTPEEAEPRAVEMLNRVGLGERLKHQPGELSGGEQQRLAVARALMNDPKLLLADEPSGNLDRASSQSLHDLLWSLSEERGQTTVIVTHNETLAAKANRIIELEDGKVK